MSTKTLRKRIALVAVSALGAGLLSVAPANAAAVGLTIGDNSSTGAAILYNVTGPIVGKSVGLSGAPVTTTATAQTAVLRSNGTLSLKVLEPTTGAKWSVVTVTGGTIIGGQDGTAGDLTVNASRTLAGSTTTDYYGLLLQPTAAGTTMVVSLYDDATAITASTGGTLTDRLYVTVTASTDIAKFSPANSFLKITGSAAAAAVTNNTDTVSALTVSHATAETAIGFSLADVNGVDMPVTTIVSATATNGALVSLGASESQVAASASDYYDGTFDNVWVYSEDGAIDTLVTISVNGVVWATKTIKFLGDVATIEIKNPSIGLQGSTGNFYLNVKDSAGNLIGSVTPVVASGVVNASISGATPAASSATSSSALSTFNCSTLSGSANLAVYTVNAALKAITSNVLKVTCAYTAYTYSASMDKASYVPGDIATLTITAKDKYGAAPADNSVLGTATTYELGIAGSNMTAVTAPTNADTFTSGVKTYKFVVGQTEGSYNMIVDLTKYNSAATPQAAVTVAYKIASGSTAVSNADVLKAIVSLIASINKQIAALQKALLKK